MVGAAALPAWSPRPHRSPSGPLDSSRREGAALWSSLRGQVVDWLVPNNEILKRDGVKKTPPRARAHYAKIVGDVVPAEKIDTSSARRRCCRSS